MEKWEVIRQRGLELLEKVSSVEDIEKLKIEFLGKKGEIQALMMQMKDLDPSERPIFGKEVNALKTYFEEEIAKRLEKMMELEIQNSLTKDMVDISLPALQPLRGNLHPMTYVLNEVEDIFISMGYEVVEGPEVELDLYNFERANIPADHPARDMQDTFFVDVERLLRTHTTAIQTRVLESRAQQLPIKVICPGKTYRRDDDDATHSHQFVQVEGLVVGENITLADLKGTLELLARKMFGESRVIRLRPSYFQFTEPSVEVDVSCMNCNGKGCSMCKQTGWIEILGAGVVHPNVLEMAGIDSKKYSGFAFGVGIERIAILKYGIEDIRNFYTNDMRFLSMFTRFE
jgi:phenylalanyl-tRNA synthetase, alpha subunit